MSPGKTLKRAHSGQLDELFGLLDANGHQRIYYSDFLAATMEARCRLREEAVRAAFNRLDADRSGTICAEDFRCVIGKTFEGIDVEELVEQADPHGEGSIDYSTFLRVLEDRDVSPSPRSRARSCNFGNSPSRRRPAEEAFGGC